MAGSANTPPNGFVFTPGSDAGYVVAGTSTQNDGRYARAYILFDPNTGSYVSTTAGGLNTVGRTLTATDVVSVVAQNGALTDNRPSPFAANTIDTPTFFVGNNNKRLIYVVIGVAINWATSGQATVQPYVSTSAQTGVGTLAPLIDTVQNLGAVGTTLAAKAYVFDSSTLPSLAQPHLYMGFRFFFPSTPTNGAGAPIITVLNGTNT